jgi:hypothetical protein
MGIVSSKSVMLMHSVVNRTLYTLLVGMECCEGLQGMVSYDCGNW